MPKPKKERGIKCNHGGATYQYSEKANALVCSKCFHPLHKFITPTLAKGKKK
jgi:protein-arginine kinase activator protein McsA